MSRRVAVRVLNLRVKVTEHSLLKVGYVNRLLNRFAMSDAF